MIRVVFVRLVLLFYALSLFSVVVCVYIIAGSHSCFYCKSCEGDTVKCSVQLCGKFYHKDCLAKLRTARIEGNNVICPLHACSTCASESTKNPQAWKGFEKFFNLFSVFEYAISAYVFLYKNLSSLKVISHL